MRCVCLCAVCVCCVVCVCACERACELDVAIRCSFGFESPNIVSFSPSRWTRDKAIDYISARTPIPRSQVEIEVDRYLTWPGQACAYKIGELKIKELRKRASDALGRSCIGFRGFGSRSCIGFRGFGGRSFIGFRGFGGRSCIGFRGFGGRSCVGFRGFGGRSCVGFRGFGGGSCIGFRGFCATPS